MRGMPGGRIAQRLHRRPFAGERSSHRCLGVVHGPDRATAEVPTGRRPGKGRSADLLGSQDYWTFTSMALAFALELFGMWIWRMPSLKSEVTFEASTSSGSAKLRSKLP